MDRATKERIVTWPKFDRYRVPAIGSPPRYHPLATKLEAVWPASIGQAAASTPCYSRVLPNTEAPEASARPRCTFSGAPAGRILPRARQVRRRGPPGPRDASPPALEARALGASVRHPLRSRRYRTVRRAPSAPTVAEHVGKENSYDGLISPCATCDVAPSLSD